MVVAEEYTWNFAYVLPLVDNSLVDLRDTELVVPDALQIGWCESPPFFCMASETTQDVIQELMDCPEQLPHHKFEHKMMPTDLQETCPQVPVLLLEVFVDDFIGATNEATEESLRHISRCMLHGVHSIFPPSEVTDHGSGDSITEKKLNKGKGQRTLGHKQRNLGMDCRQQSIHNTTPRQQGPKHSSDSRK